MSTTSPSGSTANQSRSRKRSHGRAGRSKDGSVGDSYGAAFSCAARSTADPEIDAHRRALGEQRGVAEEATEGSRIAGGERDRSDGEDDERDRTREQGDAAAHLPRRKHALHASPAARDPLHGGRRRAEQQEADQGEGERVVFAHGRGLR